tara:strand:- start:2334 stop:2489 length:156 start_codon:yes stop_codon:yes gene_type:complete
MNFYSFFAITIVIAFLIAVNQRIRGLKFWPSFFISLIAVSGVLAIIWEILS